MAADPITPGRAAAFQNTSPQLCGVSQSVDVDLMFASNLASFTPLLATQQSVPIWNGPSAPLKKFLLSQQSTNSENGIYVLSYSGGASVSVSGTFNGSGVYQKTGLTTGRCYYVRIINPGEYASNGVDYIFSEGPLPCAPDGSITFYNGATGATNSALLNEAKLVRHPYFDSNTELIAGLKVHVLFGTYAETWYGLTATVPIVGSNPVNFSAVSTSSIGSFTGSPAFDNTGPSGITPGRAASFDNTAPGTITPPILP